MKRIKVSESLIGNTHRLGYKDSEETKHKKSLSHKKQIPWNKGKNLSNETRLKMSISRKGVSLPWMKKILSIDEKHKLSESSKRAWCNPIIRKKYYDALQKTKWLQVRTDKGQLELLEKWNQLGFHFHPNYQIKTDEDLFYIDGYDKEYNVVLEYDGKYHNKSNQQQKDLIRQQKIINILKPKKFWRYNSINKTFQNILG